MHLLGITAHPTGARVAQRARNLLTDLDEQGDLLCWTQQLLLGGAMAAAEPKKLRYRLLHVAAKLSRTARTTTSRIAAGWPWTDELVTAFQRLSALPEPVT